MVTDSGMSEIDGWGLLTMSVGTMMAAPSLASRGSSMRSIAAIAAAASSNGFFPRSG